MCRSSWTSLPHHSGSRVHWEPGVSQTLCVGMGCLCLWILHPLQHRAASTLTTGSSPNPVPVGRVKLRKVFPYLAELGLWQYPAGSASLPPSAACQVIDALGQAISRTPGCVLLDVDAGASTNRTVYTFVGSPEAVVEAALSAARVAGQLIDMSRHTGELGGSTGACLAQSIPHLPCVVGCG